METDSFVEVILPLPLEPTFTYRVPESMRGRVTTGMRVIVPFGNRKFYTGIVSGPSAHAPEGFEVKEIASVPDSHPIVRHPQMKLWEWIADYYLCSEGDVMKAAIPAGLKIESESQVEANPDMEADEAAAVLTEKELHIWHILDEKGKLKLSDLAKETGGKGISASVNRMLEKGAVIISESLQERFRPKKETYVRLLVARNDGEALRKAFESVKRSNRQEAALQTLIAMSGFTQVTEPLKEVTRSALTEKSGTTTVDVSNLAKKGLVEIYTKETSRFKYEGPATGELPELTEAQRKALDEIHRSFTDKKITLLHGVTSSGKTEIYIHLTDFVLRQGRQVLYLVPEIALTTQLTTRLQKVFGNKVVIYHSRFSDNERVETWLKLLRSNEPCVVIGARSSVFLPFASLGLVIVDEEHEPSFKQYDPAPRYNGRDVATVLASMHGAHTLLGSATPSVETYYKAESGKYGLVSLKERYADIKLPEIKIVDMNTARKRMEITGAFASETTRCAREAIGNGKQVIFFHNRRGFAPLARCKQCAYVPKCQYCDVSLTYHRFSNRLVCHYCGATYPLPETCPVCKEPAIEVLGFGTERVEEDVENIFPKARMLRMDLDTTRKKDDYANIIDDFSRHKADILVGTQMVTKGLDFDDVSMVAVLNADAIINYPDFRAGERAFNMLEQVAGRAGRKGDTGLVIVQTRMPDHPIIGFLKNHDYDAHYGFELRQRQEYMYPPFARIIYLYVKHRDARIVSDIAQHYAVELRRLLGNRVYGPEEPHVSRIQNLYIRKIMLKIEPTASMKRVKEVLREAYLTLHRQQQMKGMSVYYDVDPQ